MIAINPYLNKHNHSFSSFSSRKETAFLWDFSKSNIKKYLPTDTINKINDYCLSSDLEWVGKTRVIQKGFNGLPDKPVDAFILMRGNITGKTPENYAEIELIDSTGKFIGFLTVFRESNDKCIVPYRSLNKEYLHENFITNRYENNYDKVGLALLETAVALSLKNGLEGRLTVESRPNAIKFHKKFGFVPYRKDVNLCMYLPEYKAAEIKQKLDNNPVLF